VHKKKYSSAGEEYARQIIFALRLAEIQRHNVRFDQGLESFEEGVNEFTDRSYAELAIRNGYKANLKRGSASQDDFSGVSLESLPASVDWRQENLVTPIKNQGMCGSCWAFSAVGSMEGQHAKATNDLVSLSEQNLVDCSWFYGDHGCLGGLMDNAFRYVIGRKGIDTEKSYPYYGWPGFLCDSKSKNFGASIQNFTDIQHGSELALQKAVATVGPISVAMDASHQSFQNYKTGIYNDPKCSSTKLDHGVTVIGYGTENGKDYWLVKNSWGTSWGEKGFFKLARNANNACGVATMASYPIV